MRARQCDACKELYSEDELKNQKLRVVEYDYKSYRRSNTKDLCPECYKKLLDIFGKEEV